MMKEYSSVVAIRDLSDKVKSGCIGAVVMIYDFPNLPLGYEVEFFDADGWTLDVLTVEPKDIELKTRKTRGRFICLDVICERPDE